MTNAELIALLHRIAQELTGDRRVRAERLIASYERDGFPLDGE